MNDPNQLLSGVFFGIFMAVGLTTITMGSITLITELGSFRGRPPSKNLIIKGLVTIATGVTILNLIALMVMASSEGPTSPEETPAPTPDPQPLVGSLDLAIVLNAVGLTLVFLVMLGVLIAATALVRCVWKHVAARRRLRAPDRNNDQGAGPCAGSGEDHRP